MNMPFLRRAPIVLAAALMAALGASPSARAANVALNKPTFATANSATSGNVNDNDFGDVWNDNGSISAPNDFIAIDLGAATPGIKVARIFWNSAPAGFTIDVATNVVTDPNDANFGQGDWTTVYTRADPDCTATPTPGAANPPSPESLDISAAVGASSYRYIRIQATTGNNPCATPPVTTWGVAEFQVLDAPLPSVSGIASANGSPLANAVIQINGPAPTAGGPPNAVNAVKTGATGAFTLPGLDPGVYTVTGFAPGQYAPVKTTVTVGTANVTQNLVFTTPVTNSTAELTNFNADYIATAASPKDANAATNNTALPAEELPPGDAVYSTSTPLANGGTLGANVPTTLKFYFPPTANGKNNVANAANLVIPVSPAHYTALYILQNAADGAYDTSATLNYADGTSAAVTTSSGNATYHFALGTDAASEDVVDAFIVDKLYDVSAGAPVTGSYSIRLRTIVVDSTKVLKNLQFAPTGTGNTLAKGFVYGYSADSLEVPAAAGSISGTIKAPNGSAVTAAQVVISGGPLGSTTLTQVTDATGTYKFNGLPPGTYTIGASKAASYRLTALSVTLTASQNATGQDIQFTAPIPVVTDALSNPTLDMVSTDVDYNDFTISDNALGREYIPTGLYSPAANGSDPNGKFIPNGSPSALPFQFGNILDTGQVSSPTDPALVPGTAGYPVGGTPNAVVPHGAIFLAPPAKIFNAYFAIVGFEGQIQMTPRLDYTDGTSETRNVTISDWFGTPSPSELPYLIMTGRHQHTGEANVGASIKINALVVPVNATKTLKDIAFNEGQSSHLFPSVLAVSFETDVPQPASSDIQVNVVTSGSAPAAGAQVVLGPYSTIADANGHAIFKGIPAGLSIDAGAYISGSTQQARVLGHVVPTGQKLPTPDVITVTLPAAAPHFYSLPLAYDYDWISTSDQPGDYKAGSGNDRAFPAEAFPAVGATGTINGVPYVMPHTEVGYNNVLRQNGQTLPVVPGHYSSLDIVTSGAGIGNRERIFYATFTYSDGSTDQVQYGSADWVKDWTNTALSNRDLFFRQINPGPTSPFYATIRRGPTDDQSLPIAFLAQPIPINASKTLVSAKLVPILRGISDDEVEILAATLEANDDVSAAGSTITGTVTGQPLGAGAAGPIAGALVQLDSAHAAYTNAGGQFSIPNAPAGSGTLTVIPYATGILTKTFPVTVTAGSTAAGTLNVGVGQSTIYSILGTANQENGLHQVEGYFTGYSTDSGRPNNLVTITDSVTTPTTIAGVTARAGAYASDYFYFIVDKGWMYHGRIGNAGLDPTTITGGVGKLAPHIYITIQYLDRGTDALGINYNRVTGSGTSYAFNDTYRTPQMYKTPGTPSGGTTDVVIQKTNTNTFKSFTFDLNPQPADVTQTVAEAFGAYAGENLEADFRINPRTSGTDPAEVIRSVIVSIVPNATLPAQASALNALRIAGGLAKSTSADVSVDDVNADGKITLLDAVALAKQGKL